MNAHVKPTEAMMTTHVTDPVHAAIDEFLSARAAFDATDDGERSDHLSDVMELKLQALGKIAPSTKAGAIRLVDVLMKEEGNDIDDNTPLRGLIRNLLAAFPNDPRPDFVSDEAVASAMRNLEPDISAVFHMSLIASLSLDEMLAIDNAEALSPEEYRFTISRMLIAKQEWAATHVWELAKRLRERFEAAYRGLILL